MISAETDSSPSRFEFDFAIVAVGYERRCRWVTDRFKISATKSIGLEFGFLREAAYSDNRTFFEERSFDIISGVDDRAGSHLIDLLSTATSSERALRIFVDISSMSREMIANVTLAIEGARDKRRIDVTVAYAPSKFTGPYQAAPIRRASPIKPALAGWSSEPEQPLGAIFGLGCEPGLALGALQFLEPNNAWIFKPKGTDPNYDRAMNRANEHIGDIFDITEFGYDITKPTITRGRVEALLNAVDSDFRIIVVPFGPKIFAWLAMSTVIFTGRNTVGLWAFSSKEQAVPVDRAADGDVIWHNLSLLPRLAS